MTKKLDQTEAIKILILPENHYNVDPPASLAKEIKNLPLKERHYNNGYFFRSGGELLLWIEGVAKLKARRRKNKQ
jgi:hypothetical protein